MRHLFSGLSRGTFAFLLGASVLSTAPVARAGVTFYADEATFEAAVAAAGKSLTDYTFAATPGTATSYSDAAGYTADGVNFVGTIGGGNYLWLVGAASYALADYPVASLQGPATSSSAVGISGGETDLGFLDATTAFGLRAFTVHRGDPTGSYTDTLNLTVDGSTGTATSASGSNYVSSPGSGFIGFISTTPVSSAVLTGTGAEDFVDIAQLSGTTVPEPSTWAMLLLGFAGLGYAGYRARRSAVAAAL